MSRKNMMGGLISLVALLSIGAARADEATHVQAKQHFLAGVELFGKGELIHALPEFEGSYALNPVPEVLFNIALTQKGLHRYADAIASLKRYAREAEARPGGLTPKRRADVEYTLAELKGLMGAVSLQLAPTNATVLIDGKEPSHDETPIYVDPGPHRIEASAPGYVSVRVQLAAVAGHGERLAIALVREQVQPAPAPVAAAAPAMSAQTHTLTATPPAPVERKPIWKRPGLWIGVGAAVVAIAVAGTVAGVLVHNASNSCAGDCADFRRQP